jgi:hypothetical protein
MLLEPFVFLDGSLSFLIKHSIVGTEHVLIIFRFFDQDIYLLIIFLSSIIFINILLLLFKKSGIDVNVLSLLFGHLFIEGEYMQKSLLSIRICIGTSVKLSIKSPLVSILMSIIMMLFSGENEFSLSF